MSLYDWTDHFYHMLQHTPTKTHPNTLSSIVINLHICHFHLNRHRVLRKVFPQNQFEAFFIFVKHDHQSRRLNLSNRLLPTLF